jgi:hypothetical protein
MINLISHKESIVNLEMVSNIIYSGESISFYYIPEVKDNKEKEYLLEEWYFSDEETANKIFNKIKKIGTEM